MLVEEAVDDTVDDEVVVGWSLDVLEVVGTELLRLEVEVDADFERLRTRFAPAVWPDVGCCEAEGVDENFVGDLRRHLFLGDWWNEKRRRITASEDKKGVITG